MTQAVRVISACGLGVLLVLAGAAGLAAEDWPEWRGPGRRGVWNEDGIVDRLPSGGLAVRWRAPVGAGFAGPAVAGGRVFVTDFVKGEGALGVERVHCLDESSGRLLWTREWPADYKGLSYESGPRATPTVDGGRVYALGATGLLHCLDAASGRVLWSKDYRRDYRSELPVWGYTSAPLVDGERVIGLVGGQPDATVVAWDKRTGRELWRAIRAESEPGYCSPILVEGAGRRQVLIWHPTALYGLDPATGAMLWREPFTVQRGLTVATPVLAGNRVLVSSFYNGSMLVELDPARAAARLVWKGASSSEIDSDGLHALMSTPVVEGDFVYGICSYGQMRCLDARTGARVWETQTVTGEKARWATAMFVRHRDRYFVNNDRGELILARFEPSGYRELGRTPLIKPTSISGNRRERGGVHWSHPAYANGHVVVRNDEEILSASLRSAGGR